MATRFVLKNALQQEIDREVEGIRQAADREAERVLEEARLQRKRMRKDAEEKAEREVEIRRRRTLSKTRLEGRNALLEIKREEIDDVFAEVRRALASLPTEAPQRYAEIVAALFRAGRAVLPEGPLRVRGGEAAAQALSPLLVEEAVDWVVEEELCGIILETPDGRLRCDDTLDALLQRIREEREAELEAMLFEEEHEPGHG